MATERRQPEDKEYGLPLPSPTPAISGAQHPGGSQEMLVEGTSGVASSTQ